MTSAELVEALHSGRRVYGTAITSPAPRWPEAVAQLGIDLVFLDTEHMPIDRHQLAWMCQAYRAMGLPPIVRIPSPDPYAACQALDGGAAGIIAPYIESVEQVRALRGAVKFRPLKGKRLEDRLLGRIELEPALSQYLHTRNASSALIVNIESVPALDNLEAILDVPDLDAVLIGPHDLSCSLGIPEQYDHPRFNEAVRYIVGKARAKQVGAGMHFSWGVEPQIAWARDGMNLILHSSDMVAFCNGIRGDIQRMRQELGDCGVCGGSGDTALI